MTRRDTAPGPKLPIDIRRYRREAAGLALGLHRRYGDIVRYRVGPQLVHSVAAPELVGEILHDRDSYRRGKVYGGFGLFLGDGMLTADGENWRVRRRAGQPHFHTGRLHEAIPALTAAVRSSLARWEARAAAGEPVDLVPEVMRLTLDAVCRALFGAALDERAERLVAHGPAVLSAMFPGSPEQLLPSWLPTPVRRRLRTAQGVFDAVTEELLERYARDPSGSALLAELFTARRRDTGAALTRAQIAEEARTYLWTGYETTGCGLAWTLFELARHPDVQERVRAELGTVLGGEGPSAADLPRLRYLRQVVEEALRLHPPIPSFPREPVRALRIGGYRVAAGSTVFLASQVVHRDPRYWPDPDSFDPGRFAPERPKPLPYTYFPFGGGPRRCIGAPLAELELIVAVALIAQRFGLAVAPGQRVDEHFLISLRPRPGVLLTLRP
ncbi:cytochrome P450 [Nocardia blacklockiae]|uniref:cytochrome P450 n=1 Tax=Nocardia blacklockiae TaxID=480036 RepID=UPI001895FA74|nr:cytochrome P450 [Nocardia blacklockiae]MBF6173781.1 cytochrome P450 [Nocardia blacklockiae]